MDLSNDARSSSNNMESNGLLENYELGNKIGSGSFSTVRIATHILTGHNVAIKILNRSTIKEMKVEDKVRTEIKVMRMLKHPHIIGTYEVIESPTHIYIVMEYAPYGELFDRIVERGMVPEDEARTYFQQIVSGVEYIHKRRVVHRDLKPENILLTSNYNIKIADFGFSNFLRDGCFLKTSCGSFHYAAPELIDGKLYAGPEVDVWSCGIILYALLCGHLPFQHSNNADLFKLIKNGTYTLHGHLSLGAKDLILRMLVVEPMKRMTIRQIQQHPWFQVRFSPYLSLPPSKGINQLLQQVDEEILQKVVAMKFERDYVVESLKNQKENRATVTYYLLLNHRYSDSGGYLKTVFKRITDNGTVSIINHGEASTSSGSVVAPLHNNNHVHGLRFPWLMGNNNQPLQMRPRSWTLLQCYSNNRGEIMMEVFKALKELNVMWIIIAPYVVRCKCNSPMAAREGGILHTNDPTISHNDPTALAEEIKFQVQLFKDGKDKFLLDLQRLQGSPVAYLDLCSSLISQFRHILTIN